jgi:2-methylcitrate dehydratase
VPSRRWAPARSTRVMTRSKSSAAIGYTVQSRLVDHGDFMTSGLDHTAQLAFSHNAAAGRLLGTYDFAGGGKYGSLGDVRTKEQADHDLRYLLAVALLDGNVMPAQFAEDRIRRPDVQSLLTKVSARPNAAYTDVYPQQMPAKITVRLKDGTTFTREVRDFPGMPSHPFTWDDIVGKFDQLVAGRIDSDLANEIKEAVRSVEQIQVKDLMALLAGVRVG